MRIHAKMSNFCHPLRELCHIRHKFPMKFLKNYYQKPFANGFSPLSEHLSEQNYQNTDKNTNIELK